MNGRVEFDGTRPARARLPCLDARDGSASACGSRFPRPSPTTIPSSGSSMTGLTGSSLEVRATRPLEGWRTASSTLTLTSRGSLRASPGFATVSPCSTTGRQGRVPASRRWSNCPKRSQGTSSRTAPVSIRLSPRTTPRSANGADRKCRTFHRHTSRTSLARSPPNLRGPRARTLTRVKPSESWEGGDSPEKGVIAMATGAGKTLTALICATRSQDRLGNEPFLVVVSAPSVPLIMQWRGGGAEVRGERGCAEP